MFDAFRLIAFSLLIGVAGPVLCASLELQQYARELAFEAGSIIGEQVYCELGNKQGGYKRLSGDPGVTLIELAKQDNIYLFAHGFRTNFEPNVSAGVSFSYAYQNWLGHLKILRKINKPFGACFFVINTEKGFGEHNAEIGNFLFALRAITDDKTLRNPRKTVHLVGYSAGVNYIKHAYLLYRNLLKVNQLPSKGIYDTKMKFYFLAGAHNGSDLTDKARLLNVSVAMLKNLLKVYPEPTQGQSIMDRPDTELLKRIEHGEDLDRAAFLNSRGARQLDLDSRALNELNRDFLQQLGNAYPIINVFSMDDGVVSVNSGRFSATKEYKLKGVKHAEFTGSTLNNFMHDFMSKLYTAYISN